MSHTGWGNQNLSVNEGHIKNKVLACINLYKCTKHNRNHVNTDALEG